MFGLALLFVYVFFCPFSILVTLIREEGAGLCVYRAFSYAHGNLCHFFSSSWCRGLAAASACGASWTFLLPFCYADKTVFVGKISYSRPIYRI